MTTPQNGDGKRNTGPLQIAEDEMLAHPIAHATVLMGFDPAKGGRGLNVKYSRVADVLGLNVTTVTRVIGTEMFVEARRDIIARVNDALDPLVQFVQGELGDLAMICLRQLRTRLANSGDGSAPLSTMELRQLLFGMLDRMQVNGAGVVRSADNSTTINILNAYRDASPEEVAFMDKLAHRAVLGTDAPPPPGNVIDVDAN